MENPSRGDRLDSMAYHWVRRAPALFPARNQAGPFRRGHQRLVCRSNNENRLLQIRPDELSRTAAFLRSPAIADTIRAECVGFAVAGRARKRHLRLAHVEIRAVRRTKREPSSRPGYGGLAWFRFLRALFDSRGLARSLLDAVRSR